MKTGTVPLPLRHSAKVLDLLRERIRYLLYSLRTEQAYVHCRFPCSFTTSQKAKNLPPPPTRSRIAPSRSLAFRY